MITLVWNGRRRFEGTAGCSIDPGVLALHPGGFLLSCIDSLPAPFGALVALIVALTVLPVLLLTGQSGGVGGDLVALAAALLASSGRRSVRRRGRTGGPCTRVVVLAVAVLA